MKSRGLGFAYRPSYTDKRTGELRTCATWWIQYNYRGDRRRENSGSTARSDAVKLLKKRLSEMGSGRFIGPDAEKLTFEDMAAMLTDDYKVNGRKSLDRVEFSIKALRGFFGLDRALDITGDRVNVYIRNRQEGGVSAGTIQIELAALKRMFTLAIRSGRFAQKPYIPSLKLNNVRTGFFEEPEFRSVLSGLPEYLRPPLEFAFMTGWRVKSEVLSLTWPQVDFHAGVVRLEVGSTKNGEGRTLPFSALPRLASLLRDQRERTEALEKAQGRIIAWVFHRNGEPIRDFRNSWRSACKAAGVERIPHDFRRTAVRNLERAGVPRSVSMKITGHLTEAVFRRYAIACEADLREGLEKLARLQESDGVSGRKVIPIREAASG
jgi:integrase